MRQSIWFITLCIILQSITAFATDNNLITEKSVGKIKLGMTIAQLRRAEPEMELYRSSNGEGVPLIAVDHNKIRMVELFAGEKDPDSKINENAKIQQIEVWNKQFKTIDSIHVGMLLKDVEHKYGPLKDITRIEIEGREYAAFQKQPKGIHLRVSDNKTDSAGKYENDNRKTNSYVPDAMVLSITIKN